MSAPPTSGSCSLAIVAPSAFLIGGVQTWLDYLVPGLAVAKWDIDVLLVHGAHSDADRYLQHHPFSRVRKVINPSGSREGRVRALANAIEATGADLVLGVNIADVYEAVARLREQRGRKTRVAMALHGLQASFYQDIATWKESLDAVIATNRLSVAVATRLGGLPESRTHYAPCGVPVPASAPSLESFAESSIGSSSALTLLFAGRLEADEKRVLDLPPILRALERDGVPWRLRIAGSGASESSLRAELAQFGPRVEFVGVLSESEMRHSFLRPGAVALILSPCETGPLVAWEALANGVAVVTSRFVGIGLEGSLRDGETCLTFPVGDSEAAANAIARLMDLALRRRLVDAGYRLVKERYSREASIRAWDDALRRVLATPPLARTAAKVEVPASGRLDRWLGAGRAESLRTMAGLHYAHREPGGEWPHSYGTEENPDFHRVRNALDQPHVATHGA